MKKNLKKVISAVVAFALTASSAAFAAAPSFTDVADTASYADSVKTLTALGAISGYEDGTFKPDDKITRAEVSTMIVAAINRTADAQGQMGNTKFADMNNEAKKWASGYVNVAVSEDIIAGFEDGTFRPDEQVTYAQVVKMLVCAAGYGQYASYLGGWPNGYLSVASDKGITAGVSAGQDEAVTRAQVAQLIYNTLDVPMVASNGFSISETTGAVIPSLKVMDGKDDRDYQTLLTEKHRAYKVEGYVSNTNRTNSAKCDADEVEFTIQYTENYDDSDIVVKKNQAAGFAYPTDVINVGDTDAADYLLTYATGIVKFDENDDPIFVSFVPSGKNKVEEFDASLVDDEDYELTAESKYLKFYETSSATKSNKYSLEKDLDDVKLYVNGVKVEASVANIETYVIKNTTGKVQLIDTYSAQSKANGYYDAIFVTYYATAKVDAVNTSTKKITFDKLTANAKSTLTLDPDANDKLVYSITLNGEEIELGALQKDDILSIAYDVTADTTLAQSFTKSNFYEIYVSRDKAEGKYTTKDSEDKTVTVAGTEYKFVNDYTEMVKDMTISDEYTLYLDAFGRIFDYETLASSAKLAIIDKFTKATSDDYWKATLYTSDGSVKNLQVDTSKVKSFNGKTGADDINLAIAQYVYKDSSSTSAGQVNNSATNKRDIQNRVVEYKISASTGYIIDLKVADIKKNDTGEYKANNTSVGSVKMNSATKVVDAIDYVDKAGKGNSTSTTDLKTSSLTAFSDGSDYTAFAYGDKNSDNTYPFVIVTVGSGTYTSETKLAVLTKTPEEGEDDTYNVKALYEKEEQILKTNDEVEVVGTTNSSIDDLKKGDVVAFVFDGSGAIKEIALVLSASAIGIDTDYATVKANAEASSVLSAIKLPGDAASNDWTIEWSKAEYDSSDDVTRLVYGPIVDKSNKSFTLGTYSATKTTNKFDSIDKVSESVLTAAGRGACLDINVTDETRVYVYDYSTSKSSDRFAVGSTADIQKTAIPESKLINDGNTIDWTKLTGDDNIDANYAFAKVVDGDATDVFVILAK